jgi:hypothetical protein
MPVERRNPKGTPNQIMNKKQAPKYCRANETTDPCPDCGASISGNDPVRGICQATHHGPPPSDYDLKVILVPRNPKYENI